jgi:3'(2'), 5'-bisphosphate nucleotidase
VVARGQADIYLRIPTSKTYIEKIWDHAAGSIIATEAGAIVSDITGTPLDFTCGRTLSANRGIVCAVPAAHERIIEAIERLGMGAPV